MVTIIIRPSADGDIIQFPFVSGAPTHHEALDEEVADEGATNVWSNQNTYKTDIFKHAGYLGMGDISEVRVCNRLHSNANVIYWKAVVKTHDNLYYQPEQTDAGGLAWTTFKYALAVNPYTLVAWTWPEFNGMQFGLSGRKYGSTFLDWTQSYLEVDFDPEEGGGNVGVGGVGGGGMIF